MYNKINKIASAVKNNLNAGLTGMTSNDSLSMELLEDYVVLERLQVLKEYSLKGTLPLKDLYISINCIPVDCKSLERCGCKGKTSYETPTAHFEIPQVLNDYSNLSIDYIGSTDRQLPFIYYTSPTAIQYSKYKKRGKSKPYVLIDTTPNENGMYDCFVFNAPLLESVSVSAIFKDLRLLELFSCCTENSDDNISFVDNEIIKRLSEKLLRYYNMGVDRVTPNDQMYKPG